MAELNIVRLEGTAADTVPISIQLWLDAEGNAMPRATTFGVVGGLAPGSEDIIPFVFFKDGTIDCGTGFEGTDGRYGKTNIYAPRQVVVGALFTVDWDD